MSVEREMAKWCRHIAVWCDYDFCLAHQLARYPLRLTDSQALEYLKELEHLFFYREDLIRISEAIETKRPWGVLKGAHFMCHPITRFKAQA